MGDAHNLIEAAWSETHFHHQGEIQADVLHSEDHI